MQRFSSQRRKAACQELMHLLKESIDSDINIDQNLKIELNQRLGINLDYEENSLKYLKKYAADIRSSDLELNRKNRDKGEKDQHVPDCSFYFEMVQFMLQKFPFSFLSGLPVVPLARSGLYQFSLDRLDNSRNHYENYLAGLLRVSTVTEQHLFPWHCKDWDSKREFLAHLASLFESNAQEDIVQDEREFTDIENRYVYLFYLL